MLRASISDDESSNLSAVSNVGCGPTDEGARLRTLRWVGSVFEQHGSVRSCKSGFDSRPAHQLRALSWEVISPSIGFRPDTINHGDEARIVTHRIKSRIHTQPIGLNVSRGGLLQPVQGLFIVAHSQVTSRKCRTRSSGMRFSL